MVNKALSGFSYITVVLNRCLAWLDFAVHYTSGYFLYLFLGGIKPQTHTRPFVRKDGGFYTPSVVVTGASQGIGLATTLNLASKGYNVFASVKDESEIPKIREGIDNAVKGDGMKIMGAIHPVVMDVLSQDSIQNCVRHIQSELENKPDKPLLGVVNNAGYCMISPMELTPDRDVRNIFELDFWAYISVIRAFLPLIKQNKGRFINVGSYGGYVNPPMWVPYSALKAAVEGMTRAWRMELMPFGVGMCTIRPGYTRTAGIGPKITEGWNQYYDQIPKGAVGVDSLGDLIRSPVPIAKAEEKVYGPMMEKWHKLIMAAADGAAQPAEAVAATIHDAMSDRFLLPDYTVGYDALLGQMVRDFTPESIYELGMAKTFW